MSPHPNDARATLVRADGLLHAGRWQDAASAYREALVLQPAHATAWFNLGFALRRLGLFDEALDAYGQSLRHGIDAAHEAHLNRAAIYADHQRRDDLAEAELRTALALAPDYAPAWLNLGNLHEERGQRQHAIDCYRRIMSLPAGLAGPGGLEAIARLSQLEPPVDVHDPALARLRKAAFDAADMDDGLRATLLFALGRAYDSLGSHADAFAAFTRANHHAHRGHPPYDPARTERRVQALAAAARAADTGDAAADARPEPLFICGMFRSGSTLVEQVLAAHPAIAPGGELDLLPRMVAGPLAPFPGSLAALDALRCESLSAHYRAAALGRLPGNGEGKRYATDKRPDNYLLIGLIKRLFPRAKIIHSVRHPLDNALSVFMQHLNPRAFDYAGSLAAIGHHYGQYRRLMAHWHSLYPGQIHDFDYDAFVASPEETLRALLDFLGLPWHADCLQFHRLGNTVKTASYWQVRQPLYADASGRWLHYRVELAPLAAQLAEQGTLPRGD